MVVNRVTPVVSGMSARTHIKFVVYLLSPQFQMQVLIDLVEKVIVAAVNDNGQIAILYPAGLVDNGMPVPYASVTISFTQ